MREFIFNPNRSAENFLRGKARFLTVALTATLVFAGLFAGCKVGLGDSVDTEAPAVGILYPDPKTNAIIRDEFVLYGSCQDDKQITAVKVTLINIDSGETVLSDAPAVVDSDQKHWRINLNSYSEENKYNGWQFADGKYTVTVRAYDGSHDSSSDEKSSASSSFEIDNTAPVFVIKNPGVLKTENSSPSAYGSIFTVEGTISELHSVSSMEVTVYNEAGECVSESSYNGETLKAFVEEDIEIAGGTSVIIAQSGSADGRYGKIYGDASGTQKYTCSVKLTDNSKKYVTPPETSDNRTAEEVAQDESGNSTYNVYLYDDVYDSLLSQKNEGSKKLSAGDLKNIINGTFGDAEAKNILLGAEKNTGSDGDASKRLYFSLNPEANPTYNVNGFEYSFDKTDSLQQASAGNAVSITVSQGLDQTQIDLDGSEKSSSTVKVWMKEYSDRPLDEGNVKEELTGTLAPKVKAQEDDASVGFVEYLRATEGSPVTEFGGWKLIFDYGQNNSGESSVSTKTFSVTLPAGSIALNKYYLLAVTGRDIDNVEFSQNTIYGFEGNEAGVPPTLSIEDVYADEAKTVKNLKPSSDFEFKGKATLKSSSLYTSEFMVKLTVTDQDSDKVIDTVTQTVTRSALDKGWTETAALKFSDKENWTFKPDLLGDESIKVGKEDGKSYLYTLEVWGKASSGHESSSTLNVQIDSTKPKVEITSITPTVEEYNETKGPFVNGKIYVKGTVEETNLENVEIEVLVGGVVVKNEPLGKKYSINYDIDTTKLTDNSSLEVKLIAVDKVGNRNVASSVGDYADLKIDQSTDKPLVTLNNASEKITDKNSVNVNNNLFGTVSNNKLNFSVSDDDVIDTVKIEVTLEGSDTPIEKPETVNKSTCTISYELPKTEGVYKVKITAVDKNGTENDGYAGNAENAGNAAQNYFWVAVSAGAPEIELETVPEFLKTDFIISGTVSNKISKVTAEVKSAKNNGSEIYDDLKELSDKLLLTQADGSQDWTCSLKPGETLDDAAYELLFTAKDTYGQTSSKTVKFSIDNGKPELKITQYGSNTYTEGDVSFYLIPSNEYTIKGTATDSVTDVETVLFKVGDLAENEEISVEKGWSTATLSTSGNWTALITSDIFTATALDTKDGTKGFTFNIVAIDGAGNVSEVNKDILLYPDSDAPKISNLNSTITEFNISNKGVEIFIISADITEAGGIDKKSIQVLKDNKPIEVNPTLNGLQSSKISFKVNPVEHIVNGTNTFTLKLKDLAGNEASETLTIKSDLEAPVASINGVSPIVAVDGKDNCVNGKVTVSGIVSDTSSLAGDLNIGVFKNGTEDVSATEELINLVDSCTDLTGTYKNWKFELYTSKLEDNTDYTIKVSVKDSAGNTSAESTQSIHINQSTDQPVITLSNADVGIQSLAAIKDGSKNIFGTSSNNVLKGTITDDDGIQTVKVTVTAENGTVIDSGDSPISVGGKTSYTLNYPLPDTEGGYTVEITVEDTKGETDSATNKTTFVVAVDNGAPELKISTSNGGYYNGSTTPVVVSGKVTDGSAVTLTAKYDGDGTNSASGNVQVGEGGSITDSVNISSIADNTETGYTVTYTAKDRWGQASTAVFKYYKDSVSPSFNVEKSKVAGVSDADVVGKYFKNETLSVETVFDEAGSGVETIYFVLDGNEEAKTTATPTNSGGKATVKTSISGFTEDNLGHSLRIWAVDKAGNKSAEKVYNIKVDSTAPDLSSEFYTFDGEHFETASGNVLSNKTKAITVYGTVSDSASGVGEFSSVTITNGGNKNDITESATFSYSTDELPATATKNEIAALSFGGYDSISDKTLIKSWKMVISGENIVEGSVSIASKDTAGNISTQKVFTFEVDTTAPEVQFVTPTVSAHESSSSLNGTATITGKITEKKTPKSLEFYYSKTESENLSDYTKLGEAVTDASAIYTWSKEIDFNDISKAAETDSGQADIYLLVAATDLAENKNYTDGSITNSDGFVKIPVDLNGDVPTVRITNLSIKDGKNWLVGGENATIEGTLSDDDGAIEEFIISETPITADATPTTTTGSELKWTKGSSDFTYKPSNTDDGEKTLYIYIKDAAGGVFYTGKDTSKKFTEPKVQIKSGTAVSSDEGFKYTSDGTSPVVQAIEIAYYNEETGESSEYASFTANTILGGLERKYAKFKVTATDNSGIATGTLKGVLEDLTLLFTNTEGNTWTAETNALDLSTVTLADDKLLGYVNVSVVVTDNSGQTGNASAVFTLDNEGPSTFSVTTPSAGTISTSDVTVSGIAQDGSGAGIKSIEFAVPTKAQKEAGNVGTADENGASKVEEWTGVIFGGDLKEGATAGLWSFVFADGSNGGQLTQFTEVYDSNSSTSSLVKEGFVYTIPLWFKLTDTLGNEAVYQYQVSYNPNANWPSATVLTPKNGAILGTNADFAGTAKDNNNVKVVYIQFDLNGDGVFDSTDKDLFTNKNNDAQVYTASELNFNTAGAIKSDDTDWWGVKVSGETSWNGSFSLPETDSETKNWQVRACAVDDENIAGLWSDGSATKKAGSSSVKFRVDDAAPKIGLTTLHVSNSNGTKAYSSDMYVSSKSAGEWKLVVSLEDTDSGIDIDKTTITVRLPSGSSVNVTDFEKTEIGDVTYETVTYHNYKIEIPLNLSSEGTVTYTIRTQDNSKAALSTSANYSFTVDNTAPKVGKVSFNSEELDMRKLYNSNKTAEISSDVEDSISGMESLNFFFERGGKYYVPFAGGSAGSWKMVSAEGKDFALVDGIPAVTASGNGTAKGNTFTISNTTNTDFVRAGGIVKIGGSYYNITSVSGTTVTFDGTLATDVTEAIFPYALSVNYKTTTSESSAWSDGTYSVGNDDGDGLVETVTKSGAKWTCTASLLSDSIADGTIVLHAVAIDAAGNVSSDVTTRTMIANHTPRLAKVHLATDLNNDGTCSENETDSFSALDENGKEQEISTLKTDIYEFNGKIPANTNESDNAYFKVTGDLFVAPEFVGGKSGQGTVSYDAILGSQTAPTWNKTGSLHGTLADSTTSMTGAPSITAGEGNVLRYLKFAKADMTSNFNSEDEVATIALSLWDSAAVYGFVTENGLYKTGSAVAEGTASKLNAGTLYESFGYQWTVTNIPVYFDITDDVPPIGTITPFYWNSSTDNSLYENSKEKGHIEFTETPDVSGAVVFRGKVYDDQILKSLAFAFDSEKTASSTYTAGTGNWSSAGTLADDGYEFTVKDVSIGQEGHSAEWTLTVDSAKLLANGARTLTVTATQAKTASKSANTSTPGDTQTTVEAETGYYAMKVVPYITGIARSGTTNRSRFGRYAVEEGETITVSGFNFGAINEKTEGYTVKVGENAPEKYTTKDGKDSSAASGATSFEMTVPSKSGGVVVTSGGISSTNNTNDNDGHGTATAGTTNSYRLNYYNREAEAEKALTTDYTDDRYLSVWALGNYFNGTDGGVELQKPVMTADKKGNLYASWVAQSNSNVMFSYGVAQNTTPIFRCYDQPAIYTGISFDTKGTSGGANVAFIPEHQGSGGSFSKYAMSSSQIVGGAGTIQITSSDISSKKQYSGIQVNVTGNPFNSLDGSLNGTNTGKNATSYYNLANYDMNRRLGSFENPKSARFGNVLHNIWYDNVTEGLKYSVVNTSDARFNKETAGGIVGWVVLDGGFTGQDRYYNYSTTAGSYNNNLYTSAGNQHPSPTNANTNVASYSDVIFASGTASSGATSITFTATVAKAPAVGDTVALLNNTTGSYAITIKTITSINNSTSGSSQSYTIGWDGGVTHAVNGLTIYQGNMNVVGGSATSNFSGFSPTGQSSSAGLSADIDVTSAGLPVVAYYDAANSKLKVAYASVAEPKLAANWSRVDTGLTCSGEVSMRVDSNGGIHIMFKDKKGQMCYAYAASTSDLGSMKAEVIDTNGTLAYGSISVIENGTTVVPTVTYLNVANTEDCIKYAYRTAAAGTAGEWDYLIVPSKGSGHFAKAENKISLESKKKDWTSEDTTVLTNGGRAASPATVDSVIGFNSKQFETAYLKSE